MGKGYHNYMSKKFFHPGNFENIKRVWMARQKDAHEKKAEEDTLAQYQKEQEMYQNRALLGDEKAKLGLNFMYDPPPGVKRDREKEEDEPEYKFEWQRKYNAPRESYAKGDDTVRDQPFGIEVRNVRCLKCRKWGHINTDKICPLFGNSITAEPPQTANNNPGELMEQMKEEGLAFTKKVLSRQNDPGAANQQMVDSDAEADEEIAFFLSLNRKEKKKLVKKLEKERKRNQKERRRIRKGKMEALREKRQREAEQAEKEREEKNNPQKEERPKEPYKRKRRLSRGDSEERHHKNSRSESPASRRNDHMEDRSRDRNNVDRSRDRTNDDRGSDRTNGDRCRERTSDDRGNRHDRRGAERHGDRSDRAERKDNGARREDKRSTEVSQDERSRRSGTPEYRKKREDRNNDRRRRD